MKRTCVLTMLALLAYACPGYQSQFGLSAAGDYRLEAIGRFRFSDFTRISLDLRGPSDAENDPVVLRCQVIYVDAEDDGPLETALQRRELQVTGDWLLAQLSAFVAETYAGVDRATFVEKLGSGEVGIEINERFPQLVAARTADIGLELDVVRIQVLSER